MNQAHHERTGIDQAGERLFYFAIDRDDIKLLVDNLPAESACKPTAVEYELQLLKIISTGWSLSFFLANVSYREQLADKFWTLIHEFSGSLSETTGLMTGHEIDYYEIIRSRLDMYVAALGEKPDLTEPAAVIGPAFARCCGDPDDVFSIMAGSRLFILTVARVKEYLESQEVP